MSLYRRQTKPGTTARGQKPKVDQVCGALPSPWPGARDNHLAAERVEDSRKKMSRRKEHRKWRSFKRKQSKGFCLVYGLYDDKDKLRYIGQTRLLLTDRLSCFWKSVNRKIAEGRRLTPVERWLQECRERHSIVEIRVIDDNGTWDVSEIIEIERARAAGADLLNVLRGGCDSVADLARTRANAA